MAQRMTSCHGKRENKRAVKKEGRVGDRETETKIEIKLER